MTSLVGASDELRLVTGLLASFGVVPDQSARGWAGELSSVSILDCGGGSGRLAVPLARLGATVTVVDISVDALATLSRRAAEATVADRIRPVPGDIEGLADVVDSAAFDIALVHGVLDIVDGAATLAGVRAALRPGGRASVVVTNPAAGVLSKVLAGDLDSALDDLRAWSGSIQSGHHLDAAAVTSMCLAAGLDVEQVSGVGVFTELIPSGALGAVTAAGHSVAELAAELEARSADQSPFREIAARLHVLARRPPA
jgi:2-polyprenyl-3-methyl-5-hydroxy-6-metoxy-1,4-benzoquinol methylase